MSFDILLTHSGMLYRPATVEDTLGGGAREWTALGAIPCRVRALSVGERAMSGGTGAASSHRLYCRPPLAFTPRAYDEITVSGERYRLTGINNADLQGRHLEIDMDLLKPGEGG